MQDTAHYLEYKHSQPTYIRIRAELLCIHWKKDDKQVKLGIKMQVHNEWSRHSEFTHSGEICLTVDRGRQMNVHVCSD